MNGIWLEQNALTLRTDLPIPVPSSGEALVRVLKGGICNTDIELLRGYYPYRGVLGHEFVGVVAAADDRDLIDRRVVGEINAACGTCPYCVRGIKGIVRSGIGELRDKSIFCAIDINLMK